MFCNKFAKALPSGVCYDDFSKYKLIQSTHLLCHCHSTGNHSFRGAMKIFHLLESHKKNHAVIFNFR